MCDALVGHGRLRPRQQRRLPDLPRGVAGRHAVRPRRRPRRQGAVRGRPGGAPRDRLQAAARLPPPRRRHRAVGRLHQGRVVRDPLRGPRRDDGVRHRGVGARALRPRRRTAAPGQPGGACVPGAVPRAGRTDALALPRGCCSGSPRAWPSASPRCSRSTVLAVDPLPGRDGACCARCRGDPATQRRIGRRCPTRPDLRAGRAALAAAGAVALLLTGRRSCRRAARRRAARRLPR